MNEEIKIDEEIDMETSQRSEIDAIELSGLSNKRALRILIVNDEPMNILILETLFESLGCETEKAFNGFEATEKARNNTYDAIMMDLEMPLCNGF